MGVYVSGICKNILYQLIYLILPKIYVSFSQNFVANQQAADTFRERANSKQHFATSRPASCYRCWNHMFSSLKRALKHTYRSRPLHLRERIYWLWTTSVRLQAQYGTGKRTSILTKLSATIGCLRFPWWLRCQETLSGVRISAHQHT